MADKVIEAVARSIRIMWESALRSSAAELAGLALELADVDFGVDEVLRDDLRAAGDALRRADSTRRSQAILDLLGAAAALEGAVGGDMESLRRRASVLALACREHRQAAQELEESRLAAAEREELRVAGPWWMLLLRGWLPRRAEKSVETLEGAPPSRQGSASSPTPSGDGDAKHAAAVIAADFVSKELARRDELVKVARGIEQAADVLGVPHDLATDGLVAADDVSAAVVVLGTAAAELEREATAQLRALRAPLARLADACREHQQAAEAMEVVQRAAEERAQQREDADGTVVQNERLPAPIPVQGNELSSECSAMQGTALLGTLTMLPYMGGKGADGLLNPEVYSYRRTVGIAFACLWCIVGTGVPCLMGRRPFLHTIARVLGRVGMLAATLLVIFYCRWSLAPDWTQGIWALVAIAVLVHALLFGLACYDRDL
ncbi:unnamed protein product [Urochloa decumbens]|uniref:Uncharacterized protein n=1 Tax=Urochloa decumbens TaxID=240449 RepID=A0ABC8Z758_9POAL